MRPRLLEGQPLKHIIAPSHRHRLPVHRRLPSRIKLLRHAHPRRPVIFHRELIAPRNQPRNRHHGQRPRIARWRPRSLRPLRQQQRGIRLERWIIQRPQRLLIRHHPPRRHRRHPRRNRLETQHQFRCVTSRRNHRRRHPALPVILRLIRPHPLQLRRPRRIRHQLRRHLRMHQHMRNRRQSPAPHRILHRTPKRRIVRRRARQLRHIHRRNPVIRKQVRQPQIIKSILRRHRRAVEAHLPLQIAHQVVFRHIARRHCLDILRRQNHRRIEHHHQRRNPHPPRAQPPQKSFPHCGRFFSTGGKFRPFFSTLWKIFFHTVENILRQQPQHRRAQHKRPARIRHGKGAVPLNHPAHRVRRQIRPQRQARQQENRRDNPRAPDPFPRRAPFHSQRCIQPEGRQHAPRHLEKMNEFVGVSNAAKSRQQAQRAIERKVFPKRQQQRQHTQATPEGDGCCIFLLPPPECRRHGDERKQKRQNAHIHIFQFEILEPLARGFPALASPHLSPIGPGLLAAPPARPPRRNEIQTLIRRLAPLSEVGPTLCRIFPFRHLRHPRTHHRHRSPSNQQGRH